MKKKDLQQIKNKPEQELRQQVVTLKDTLWNLQKDLDSGKVKNIKEIHKAKKEIAQVLTILNNKR